MTNHWDALLFDFDGVLADTEPLHYGCWKEILEPFGIELDWDFYVKKCVGITDRRMIEHLASARVPPIPFDELWSESERKRIIYSERLMSNPPVPKQTVAMIKHMCLEYKLAVVSSSGRLEVEPPLEATGVRQCFQALVCGREVPNLKPAPDPYLRAAELLGARRPLVVEDSDAGVASAEAAGFDVVRISHPAEVASEVMAALRSRRDGTI